MRRGNQIVIVGPGHWGSALGNALKDSGYFVEFLGEMHNKNDWDLAFSKPCICLIATPFKEVPKILEILKRYALLGIINAAKGIDRKSLLTFTSIAEKLKIGPPTATLSGPTFAKELAQKKPTACVIAGRSEKFIQSLAKGFSNSYFRLYTSHDPLGVEACGAIKNILAIACGISDGLGLGNNARAALLTRGLREMASVVEILGGKEETVYGLAGVGDLWLTATGDLSRNRTLGLKLASGKSLSIALKELKGPAEGYYTVKQAVKLGRRHRLDLPISEQVLCICEGRQTPKKAILELMTRELKAEVSKSKRAR